MRQGQCVGDAVRREYRAQIGAGRGERVLGSATDLGAPETGPVGENQEKGY